MAHVALPQRRRRRPPGPPAPPSTAGSRRSRIPQLTALVTEALARNTDLAVAATRVEQARLHAKLAGAQLWPSVDLLARGGGKMSGDGSGLQGGVISASWELDLWARVRSGRAAAAASAAGAAGRLRVCPPGAGGHRRPQLAAAHRGGPATPGRHRDRAGVRRTDPPGGHAPDGGRRHRPGSGGRPGGRGHVSRPATAARTGAGAGGPVAGDPDRPLSGGRADRGDDPAHAARGGPGRAAVGTAGAPARRGGGRAARGGGVSSHPGSQGRAPAAHRADGRRQRGLAASCL